MRATAPYRFFTVNFYAWTGVGYGLAGVVHQVTLTPEVTTGLEIVCYVMVTLGSTALSMAGAELLSDAGPCVPGCTCFLNVATLLLGAAAIAWTAVRRSLLFAGVYSAVVLLLLEVIWAYRAGAALPGSPRTSAFAALLMLASLLVQLTLAPTCGAEGYADCWRGCPLPTAQYFGALLHTVFAVGLLILALSMYCDPCLAEEKGDGEVEESPMLSFSEPIEADLLRDPQKCHSCVGCVPM